MVDAFLTIVLCITVPAVVYCLGSVILKARRTIRDLKDYEPFLSDYRPFADMSDPIDPK